MAQGSYKQFCPVAMAAEILCTRWTVVLLRELIAGSTRFNDLRRGVPRMSPALLSQRLKELEAANVITPDAVAERARRLRVSADRGRPRTGAACGGVRHLGPALGRQRAVTAASRCAAADVGHAPQPRPRPDAEAAQRDPVPVSGAAAGAALVVAAGRSERRRSICARSTPVSMSTSMSRPICAP